MFKIELTGIYNNKELAIKLRNLVNLLENENGSYDLKFVVEEVPGIKKDKLESARAGYTLLATDVKGLHEPMSEYAQRTSENFTGIVERNGRQHYQTYYICECGFKGKHYLTNGTKYCVCKECGKRMVLRYAVKDEHLKPDSHGNFYIAGKFKRDDEMNEDKSLYELFGAKDE